MSDYAPERAYLDWNATAPLLPQAREAVAAALELAGNPSSVHAEGRAARRLIEQAREEVARLIGAASANVIFTSGGTEANQLALTPAIEVAGEKRPRDWLLVSAIEHPSVRSGGRFPVRQPEELPVTPDGTVDLSALEARLGELAAEGIARPLVSIMHANNETGAIQPVAAAAGIVHRAGGLLHVDAVQSAGRIPCDIRVLGADLVTLSGHKLGGPKGVGALVLADRELHFATPLITGGGQERARRSGTENVPGIAGFGAAAQAARQTLAQDGASVRALRDRIEAGLREITPAATIFSAACDRLPNTTLFAVPGIKGETAVIALDLDGVAVSSGAACSSGKVQASHVLAAMRVEPALARGAIRVSLGATTQESEIERFFHAWRKLSEALHKTRHVGRNIAA